MKLKIKNALISVSDKEDIVPLLKVLKKNNIKIISSGGTYKILKKLGYECTELSKYTGFKEMLDGRYMPEYYTIDKIKVIDTK